MACPNSSHKVTQRSGKQGPMRHRRGESLDEHVPGDWFRRSIQRLHLPNADVCLRPSTPRLAFEYHPHALVIISCITTVLYHCSTSTTRLPVRDCTYTIRSGLLPTAHSFGPEDMLSWLTGANGADDSASKDRQHRQDTGMDSF